MSKEFNWTDELVKEFVALRIHDGNPNVESGLLNLITEQRMGYFKAEKQSPPLKERIEVTKLQRHQDMNECHYEFETTKPIEHIGNSKIKQAIEQVLNDDKHIVSISFSLWDSWQKSVDILRSVLIKNGVKPDYNEHYNYTQEQVEQRERDAFNAAKKKYTGVWAGDPQYFPMEYPTYEDYKQSLNK